MLKEIITTGESVEIAFKNGCEQLGVDESKAEMEVLEQAVKKTLGIFGGSPAKVRVFVKEYTAVEKAENYIRDIFANMGISEINIDVKEEENSAEFNISGENISFIIGHRGDTLDSLQYLTSLVANNDSDNYFRISLDVGGFRLKREDVLTNLGKKMASKAMKYGKNQRLEPMNPYERRIIHFAVQEIEGVKSWSEGEDLLRHVVIGPEEGERTRPPYRKNSKPYDNNRKPNNNYNKNNNYNNKAPKKPKYNISESAPQPFSPAPLDTTTERKKVEDAPLYGRIR